MFSVGDYIAHPLHGAGVIDSIVVKRIDGTEREYYALRLPVGDMLVLVPVEGSESIGVRPVISPEEAAGVLDAFSAIDVSMTQNWNKRYRENMVKLKSGRPMDVAEVVKGLMSRDSERGLSTGERRMLHSAKQILISEIVVALNLTYAQVEQRLSESMG
ncbi:MAG: CarD family transcriptional regulator [Oscillospiraceae bacterium]|nr:CarD family transcriptional regulator [Oscillospiraceae bacterium]